MTTSTKGAKHLCTNCETRFFDLGKLPPTCPKCGTVVEEEKPKARSKGHGAHAAKPAPVKAAVEEDVDIEIDVDEDLDEAIEDEEEGADLMEDTSDLGDDDDVPGVIDGMDDDADTVA